MKEVHTMNEIIKNIEAAQLKENVPSFNVGDTVKVYNKICIYCNTVSAYQR